MRIIFFSPWNGKAPETLHIIFASQPDGTCADSSIPMIRHRVGNSTTYPDLEIGVEWAPALFNMLAQQNDPEPKPAEWRKSLLGSCRANDQGH